MTKKPPETADELKKMADDGAMDINNLPKPWTRKQYKFALAYIENPNGAEAARKAGFSKKMAKQLANRLLTDVSFRHIQNFIAAKATKAIAQFERSAEKTLNELAYIAHSNMLDFVVVGDDGLPYVDARRATREQWAAISKIKVKEMPPFKFVENGEEVVREVLSVELSLWEKKGALDTLGRYQKLENPIEVHHTGDVKVDLPDLARRMAFLLAKAAHDKGKKPNTFAKDPKMNDTKPQGVGDGTADTQNSDPHG